MRVKPTMISATISSQRAKSGITFIELFIVIIIIGILIGISIPKFRKTFTNLQLNSFSRDLQSLMNYLQQRSIVEGKIIYLSEPSDTDNTQKKYEAKIKDLQAQSETLLKTLIIPNDIEIEADQKEIIFYPDGSINKVTITLSNPDQHITLTTEGIFGSVKLQASE